MESDDAQGKTTVGDRDRAVHGVLARFGEALTVGEVNDSLKMSHGAVRRSVYRLVAAGLVEEAGVANGRSVTYRVVSGTTLPR